MSTPVWAAGQPLRLEAIHVEDLKLAAAKMLGAPRRAFEAEMVLKYCAGNARRGEQVFGWSRHTIELGLAERRTGVVCIGAQEAFCGNKLWEERQPEAAAALWAIAESHAQQDPSFRGTLADALNRNGYRLRPVVKAKPQKKSRKPTPSSPTSTPRMDEARTAAKSSACPWTAKRR